ncbi:hypothetical protein GDO81_011847 [Engystomops pustulosus]|uniref:Secreted protein n=1 Tax=Engystomops pustulosus TaxID=76066 RepID=A0AAV7BHG2_ENGPU|nr:hypothetical protein GDO81_011847 [Engystomops pustulosus]
MKYFQNCGMVTVVYLYVLPYWRFCEGLYCRVLLSESHKIMFGEWPAYHVYLLYNIFMKVLKPFQFSAMLLQIPVKRFYKCSLVLLLTKY